MKNSASHPRPTAPAPSSRAKPDRSRLREPEQILSAAVAILQRWEAGASWQEELPASGARDILQNGLFTLFRKRAALLWLLEQASPKPVRPRLRRVLEWALTELLFLKAMPDEVCVDLCVAFTRRRYSPTEAGFVNALLRRLLASDPAGRLASAAVPPWVRLNLSRELHAAWANRLSPAELAGLAELLQTPAPLTVRIRKTAKDRGFSPLPMLAPLDGGVDWAAAGTLFTCTDPAAFFATPEFRRGDFYIQDPSTLLAPALLAVQPGETVADLCAAPGGKSLLLAEALDGCGKLVCADRSEERLRRVRENLAGYGNADIIVADAVQPPWAPASFDAVLLDVPCSNSGVIRRRPDVRWRFSKTNTRELAALQAAILDGTAPLVRSGGRLVYSTCSIEPEEDGVQARAFLARHPEFSLVTERLLVPAALHDGAYAALLRKV